MQRLLTLLFSYASAEWLYRQALLQRRIRKISAGIILLFLSLGIVLFSAGMFILTLFFRLADLSELVQPALLTGVISALVALLVSWTGWNMLRH